MIVDLTAEEIHQLRRLIVADSLAQSGIEFPARPISENFRETLLEKLRIASGGFREASDGLTN